VRKQNPARAVPACLCHSRLLAPFNSHVG
jgi:hypothetical protein